MSVNIKFIVWYQGLIKDHIGHAPSPGVGQGRLEKHRAYQLPKQIESGEQPIGKEHMSFTGGTECECIIIIKQQIKIKSIQ